MSCWGVAWQRDPFLSAICVYCWDSCAKRMLRPWRAHFFPAGKEVTERDVRRGSGIFSWKMILETDRLEFSFVLYLLPAVWPWKISVPLCVFFFLIGFCEDQTRLMKCFAQCLVSFNKWQFLLPILGQLCPISFEHGRKKGGRRQMECNNHRHQGEWLLERERGKGTLGNEILICSQSSSLAGGQEFGTRQACTYQCWHI